MRATRRRYSKSRRRSLGKSMKHGRRNTRGRRRRSRSRSRSTRRRSRGGGKYSPLAKDVLSLPPRKRSVKMAQALTERARNKALQGDHVGAAADERKVQKFVKLAQPRGNPGNQILSKPMKKTKKPKSPVNKFFIDNMQFDGRGSRIGKDSSIEP